MSMMINAVVVSVVASLFGRPEAASPGCDTGGCKQAPARVDAKLVRDQLKALLAAEGLPATRIGEPLVRHVDLDGDPSTAEALVDVVSLEHCTVAGCVTLVVRQGGDLCLTTLGHGRALLPASSRNAGWADLVEPPLPLFASRALKFNGGRYR